MSLRFLSTAFCLTTLSIGCMAQPLKVCADPDNMPFSNRRAEGFDNRIAQVLAHDLNRQIVFVWQRAGRGFIRENLNKGICDVLVGVPEHLRAALTTAPYYTSSYVFVSRKDKERAVNSFDDPRLKKMKIGVQVLEDDYAPPARALSRRRLTANIVGFDVAGPKAEEIIEAVARKTVDVAVVWGPLAGYYAAESRVPLRLEAAEPAIDPPQLPFRFGIAVGVRKTDAELRDQLQQALDRERGRIQQVLRAYSVPQYGGGE